MVREQDKILHLGVISTAGTSGKALVTHPNEGFKNPKKPKSHHNKHTKGTKPSQLAPTPNGEKSTKGKDKKTIRHCNYCGRDNHVESKCFKKMAALEEALKRNNINLDTPSNSSAHGHALSASSFSFNASSTATANEWLIDSGASYHMAKDKAMFSTLNQCNTKQIYVGDDRSLNVVGSGTVKVDGGSFNDVLCVPNLSCNLLSVYQITHSGEGKIVEFSPHQVVIKDLKNPKHVLATGIVDDVTRLYRFDNFGSSTLPSIFVAHSDDLSKLWHERYGNLNYHSFQQLCK